MGFNSGFKELNVATLYDVLWKSYNDVSERAFGQLWPSVFGHSEWKHPVRFVMADEEDVSVKMRQRCVIEFCVKLGKSSNETLEMLRQAYGGETLSCAAVFQCWRHFKNGNTRVTDKARSGFCCSLMRTGWSYSTGFPCSDSEQGLLCKRPENPFAWSHEKEKTGFAQETVVFAPG